jgi:large subunit ribosomal protein L3
MAKFILGEKLQMSQKFLPDGRVVPLTVVQAGPCEVVQIKNATKDGYQAVQVGWGLKKKISKPLAGHTKGLKNFRHLKEFKVTKTDNLSRGQIFDVTTFQVGDILKVTSVSKGKGFQGVVKRHHFHGHPVSHGHKDQERMPGSIGSTDSNRVFKGTRMAGHMGDATVTVRNLELMEIDKDKNLLYIKGAIPGARHGLVIMVAEGDLVFVDKKEETKIEVKAEVKEGVKTEVPVEVKEIIKPTEPQESPVEDLKKVEEAKK